MPETIQKAEYEILAQFRYTLRLFLHFSEMAAQEVGLKPQQHQALLAIQGFPGRDQVLIGELAERLQIRHHSAVGLVDRLVAQNLLERTPSVEDHRQVFVQLTPHGKEILHQLSWVHQQELQRIAPQLNQIVQALLARAEEGGK